MSLHKDTITMEQIEEEKAKRVSSGLRAGSSRYVLYNLVGMDVLKYEFNLSTMEFVKCK